jgi:glycine oxidase
MPRTDGQKSFDAIVVGAGLIGQCCAWRAAMAGALVAVLERAAPPAGATRVAAGMLAPVGEIAFGEERLLELTLAAARGYPEFVADLEAAAGIESGYRRCGALHVALDRDEAAELRRAHDLQRELGLEAEWLTPARCRELEPGIAPAFHGGVHAPGEAAVDPRALSGALARALETAGAEVRRGSEPSELLFDGEVVAGVRLQGGGELRAPAVVLATGAGAGSDPWLPEEARPPVRPVKGQILELGGAAAEPVCERIVASERVYAVPRPDGRLIVGATVEERGFDTAVTAGGVLELLREVYRLLPDIAELELLEAAAGLRPGTPDNLPLIGDGAVEGLLLAAGHYRNGVLLAPLTGELIARRLASPGDWEPPPAVDPARFSGRPVEVAS